MNHEREVCSRGPRAAGHYVDWEGGPETGWKEPSLSTYSTQLSKNGVCTELRGRNVVVKLEWVDNLTREEARASYCS